MPTRTRVVAQAGATDHASRLEPDCRFGYAPLPLYWREPATRHAFLITTGGRVAGFILATRGSPASDDPGDLGSRT